MLKFCAIAAAIALTLASCGGVSQSRPPAQAGVRFAPNFEDRDPVAFSHPAPAHFAVHGIDAARFQTNINWNEARRNGVNFAFLKATEGGDLLDPAFKKHWRAAGRAQVARGAYHFYYFCTAPEVQANWFIRHVPKTIGALPPVLDMEWNPFSPTCAKVRPPAAEVRRQMRLWLRRVETHYGQRPIIYTTPKFYAENGLVQFRNYEFWLRSTAQTPAQTYPGQNWRFWQYTATGRVPRISGDVDLNAFSGTRADWIAWKDTRAN